VLHHEVVSEQQGMIEQNTTCMNAQRTVPGSLGPATERHWLFESERQFLPRSFFPCLRPAPRRWSTTFTCRCPKRRSSRRSTALETGVGTTLDSVFSVVVTGEGTVIYYDQWEDGYEVDLAHPTQATTKIWGDGNNANGIPPGYTNDPVSFPAGTVIALRNLVPLPRNPSTLLYDARDRIAATKALVVSRAAWATTPGPVLSGAVEVTATIDYGTELRNAGWPGPDAGIVSVCGPDDHGRTGRHVGKH
jgi:hypothetical protein